jgi:hypothetical protein
MSNWAIPVGLASASTLRQSNFNKMSYKNPLMPLDDTQKHVSSDTYVVHQAFQYNVNLLSSTPTSPKKRQLRNIPLSFLTIVLALWALWVLCTIVHLTDLMVSRYTRFIGRRPSRLSGGGPDEEEVGERTPLLKRVDGKVDKKVRFDVENTTVWKFDEGRITDK